MIDFNIFIMILLACMGGYIVSSIVLLRFPTLLHKKKQLKFCARHISHRGGAAENLENTVKAFEHADSLGTQMFELDCQLTKDGQVVVCHDDKLLRSCDCDIKISDTKYQDLPLLKPKLKVEFMPSTFAQGEDRKIPLLETIFQQFPHMPINIDVKTNNDLLIEKVHELVCKYDREEITAWGNRSDEVCQKLYRLNSNVLMIFSMRRVLCLMLFFWTGLLPFLPLKESLLEVVVPITLLGPDSILSGRLTTPMKAFFKISDMLLMRPALIKHLERRGIQTYLWVLNTEQDFKRAFELGAHGVMTDRVTLLKRYLDENHDTWLSQRRGPLLTSQNNHLNTHHQDHHNLNLAGGDGVKTKKHI